MRNKKIFSKFFLTQKSLKNAIFEQKILKKVSKACCDELIHHEKSSDNLINQKKISSEWETKNFLRKKNLTQKSSKNVIFEQKILKNVSLIDVVLGRWLVDVSRFFLLNPGEWFNNFFLKKCFFEDFEPKIIKNAFLSKKFRKIEPW